MTKNTTNISKTIYNSIMNKFNYSKWEKQEVKTCVSCGAEVTYNPLCDNCEALKNQFYED